MKLEVEVKIPMTVTVKVEIDAKESEIRELYDLDCDNDVEDYVAGYVNEHRFDDVTDTMNLDSLKVSFDSRVTSKNIETEVNPNTIDWDLKARKI